MKSLWFIRERLITFTEFAVRKMYVLWTMFKTFACCLEIKPSRQAHKEGRTPHIFLVSSYLSLGEHWESTGRARKPRRNKKNNAKISYLFLMKRKKPVISFYLFMALSLDTFKLQKINTIVESYFQLLVSRSTSWRI